MGLAIKTTFVSVSSKVNGEKLWVTIYNVWKIYGRYFPLSCIRFYAIQLPLYFHYVQSSYEKQTWRSKTGNPLQHVESLHADRERTGLLEVCGCLCGVFSVNQQGFSVLWLSSCWVCAQWYRSRPTLWITLSNQVIISAYRRYCCWVFGILSNDSQRTHFSILNMLFSMLTYRVTEQNGATVGWSPSAFVDNLASERPVLQLLDLL